MNSNTSSGFSLEVTLDLTSSVKDDLNFVVDTERMSQILACKLPKWILFMDRNVYIVA